MFILSTNNSGATLMAQIFVCKQCKVYTNKGLNFPATCVCGNYYTRILGTNENILEYIHDNNLEIDDE